jgi:transcriptional regulator with XRE-family HTH domain
MARAAVLTRKRRPIFIRAWRKHRGLTLENLAERIGTTHASLSRIERGEQPYNQDLLDLLADELRCEPADLIARNPLDSEPVWMLWRDLTPAQRKQALRVLKALREQD